MSSYIALPETAKSQDNANSLGLISFKLSSDPVLFIREKVDMDSPTTPTLKLALLNWTLPYFEDQQLEENRDKLHLPHSLYKTEL